MPTFYAINQNILSGSITFNNSKVGEVIFGKTFAKVPIAQVTLSGASSSSVPFKANITKTGMTIKFQSSYTGDCDWVVMER